MSAHTLPELTCQELIELVTDYLEDCLAPVERARFDAHIADCEYCATYLEQMRETIRTLGRIPEEWLSDEVREEMLAAFRSWRRA